MSAHPVDPEMPPPSGTQEPAAESRANPSSGSGVAGQGADPADAPAPDPLQTALAEAAKLKDQLLRTAADFDNFRKRARREEEEAARKGRETTLRELLPVFDNLGRAAQHAETATDVHSLAEGVRMVLRQFDDTLAQLGVQRVAGVGSPFDPMVHEAIQHLETDQFPPGSVAVEVQAGYLAGERLLRAAMVVVAKRPAQAPPAEPPAGSEAAPGSSDTATEPGVH